MPSLRPRAGMAGYHNAALGTAGVVIPFPTNAYGCIVSVSAGCYVGVGGDALLALGDATYGSVLNGAPYTFTRARLGNNTETHLHIAPWTGTAAVAVAFI